MLAANMKVFEESEKVNSVCHHVILNFKIL